MESQKACVVSFCKLQAGDAFNVIPHTVEMKGTVRTFEPAVEQAAYQRLNEIVSGVGQAMGCQVDITIDNITPAVINDPFVTSLVKKAAIALLPNHILDESGKFTMGAEDFAFYQKFTIS